MQALRQFHAIALGLDVLGNPYGLLTDIGEGVKDLFYEPYQVLTTLFSPRGKMQVLQISTTSILQYLDELALRIRALLQYDRHKYDYKDCFWGICKKHLPLYMLSLLKSLMGITCQASQLERKFSVFSEFNKNEGNLNCMVHPTYKYMKFNISDNY